MDSAVPSLDATLVKEDKGVAETEQVCRLLRIRVVLQQDLPLGLPPLGLLRKGPGDLEELLSGC